MLRWRGTAEGDLTAKNAMYLTQKRKNAKALRRKGAKFSRVRYAHRWNSEGEDLAQQNKVRHEVNHELTLAHRE